MLNYLSAAVIPLIITAIIGYGMIKKVNIFECFVSGAKEGIETTVNILPSLIGLVCAISMLRASGAIEYLCIFLQPMLNALKFPKELVPLAVMRPISGSGALAVINDIINTYGPDSFIGKCASVMAGSTETTFYTLAVYLGSVGVTNSRFAAKSSLLADFAAIVSSVILVRLMLH